MVDPCGAGQRILLWQLLANRNAGPLGFLIMNKEILRMRFENDLLESSFLNLDAIHVVPGGPRNRLVEGLVNTRRLKYGVVAIYSKDTSMEEFCRDHSIPYYNFGYSKKTLIRQAFNLLSFVRLAKPKTLYLHSFYPSLLGILLCVLQRKTIVIPVRHHNRVHSISKNRRGIVGDLAINKFASHIVAVSDSVKSTMKLEGCSEKKIHVILNGVDTHFLRNEQKRNEFVSPRLNILAIGRLDWQKNYETMFLSLKILKTRGADFTLHILGDGIPDYKESLIKIAEDLGILSNIVWEGWQKDVPNWFNKSDLFLHTALDEACPLVLIEALLHGIPMVSSNAGGSRDVLEGFYQGVDAFDAQTFADEILRFQQNPVIMTTYAKSIIARAEQKFSIEVACKEYVKLTEHLIGNRHLG